jgi:hypothetical protein
MPNKYTDHSSDRIHHKIDPARMPSGDIQLQNFDHRAEDYQPSAQNPLAPRVGQAKQNAEDQKCHGMFDIMGRILWAEGSGAPL